ncbi:Crp/Fnr family transcriptional regulator [Maridesulfovibrio sp.]|uniref:Crp/Fnr family transcriptional regulator n=1 Tax=Maridesulfovibrio sp. TaxID=2795000 RepID=UPI0029CA0922|nr:Crp/Fnr family transcriptional regulator [Maridesulfovibrio sp.]
MSRTYQNTKEIIAALQKDINLNRADLPELAELSTKVRRKNYRKGEIIFKAGDDSNNFCLVESGKVILSKQSPSGKSFTYLIATRGMTLNGITCFKSGPRLFSARVVQDSAIITIPCQDFKFWVENTPAVAMGILGTMGELLDGAYTRIIDLIDESVETRILNVLSMLSTRIGENLPLTNGDIAEMVGTSRESAARVISRLQEAGIVTKARGSISILNKEQLDETASSPFFII